MSSTLQAQVCRIAQPSPFASSILTHAHQLVIHRQAALVPSQHDTAVDIITMKINNINFALLLLSLVLISTRAETIAEPSAVRAPRHDANGHAVEASENELRSLVRQSILSCPPPTIRACSEGCFCVFGQFSCNDPAQRISCRQAGCTCLFF